MIKVLGAVDPADILTKYLDRKTLDAALITMRMVGESGRAASAPQAAESFHTTEIFSKITD